MSHCGDLHKNSRPEGLRFEHLVIREKNYLGEIRTCCFVGGGAPLLEVVYHGAGGEGVILRFQKHKVQCLFLLLVEPDVRLSATTSLASCLPVYCFYNDGLNF